jgi:hypothetical protein
MSCDIPRTTSRCSRLHCNDPGIKVHGCIVGEVIRYETSFLGLGLCLLQGVVQKLEEVGPCWGEGGKTARTYEKVSKW